MNLFRSAFLALLAVFLCPAAEAATTFPAQGLWWNRAEHGIYYNVSVGPTGFMFVGVTTYRTDGEPTFLVMQGPFEPASNEPGITGRLHSPLYRMQGGQCLGCDYRNAETVHSEYGDAVVEFHADGRAVFVHDGKTTAIEQFPLYTSAASSPVNRHAGDWTAVLRDSAGVETSRVTNRPDPRSSFPFLEYQPNSRLWRYATTCGGRAYLGGDEGIVRVISDFPFGLGSCFRESFQLQEREGALRGGLSPTFDAALRGLDPNASLTLVRTLPSGVDSPVTPWRPAQGLWWNPAEHGIYYHLSVGPGGFVFVAITLYDAAGEPTFLVMQGDFAPTSIEQWRATGETGRLHSPLYRMRGGQCLTCTYSNPTTVASEYGDADIVFFSDGRASFEWNGRSTPIETFPLYASEAGLRKNRLLGRWQVQLRDKDGAVSSGIVRLGWTTGELFGQPLLYLACESCEQNLQDLVNLYGKLIAYDRSPTLVEYPIGHSGAVSPSFEFHERDGVLLGRPYRGASHPEISFDSPFLNTEMNWTKLPE